MGRLKKTPKADPIDAQPRPAAEELFDQATVERLDKLQVPEVEDVEGAEAKLERIPSEKRQEASRAMKSYVRRMRRYVFDGEDDSNW